MTMTPGKFQGLRRIADGAGRFKMVAVDQRPPIENLVRDAGVGPDGFESGVADIKMSLIQALAPTSSAILMDPQYVFPDALRLVPRDKGVLVTLEYDKFEETPTGRLSSSIPDWSVAKIKASGGDAVKVLAWYRPDAAPDVLDHQKRYVSAIGDECERYDIPFVFELLVYPMPSESGHTVDYVESPTKKSEHVIESVETFADSTFGVDLFKLESPVPVSSLGDDGSQAAFDHLGRAAGRPWVMLSAGASSASFRTILEHAYGSGASGYLAGRAIWWDECKACYPDIEKMNSSLADTSVAYMSSINELTDDAATPWTSHPVFGDSGPELDKAGPSFRSGYQSGNSG